jgi:hypothetical protein
MDIAEAHIIIRMNEIALEDGIPLANWAQAGGSDG